MKIFTEYFFARRNSFYNFPKTVLKSFIIISAVIFWVGCSSTDIKDSSAQENQVTFIPSSADDAVFFTEIWGYVMKGRESEFNLSMPVSDVGYFVDAITSYSEVPAAPVRNKNFSDYKGRVHLVTSCDSTSQTHLLLDPSLPLREKIIDGLIKSAETYEGLQIDWELVTSKDSENFFSFLSEIKSRLNGKILSVAVRARLKSLQNDAYDYKRISEIADKVIIMAYDEHWSTSKPGPIGSLDWCCKIADYAKTVIPKEKLIMGISFYGRTWSDDKTGGRAWYHEGIERIIKENKVKKILREETGEPYFTFTKKSLITGYFDDVTSLCRKFNAYKEMEIENIAFWRIGQESPKTWEYLGLKNIPEIPVAAESEIQ